MVGDYVDVVMIGDDVAGQEGLLFSPKLWKELIKPVEKRFCQAIKRKTKAYLFFHSCGSVYKLISDFIEMGVDILNPVQVSAKDMDTKRLKVEFGDRITFWGGGCDTGHALPYGKPEDVEREVKRRIADLAPGGGFIFTQVHNIQSEVPPENVVAMFEAVKKYGKYA